MLVDAGADVNARHGRTLLTPLLMACNQLHPDVETIRSFLDKGAYPNWRDVQGRTAFGLIMYNQQQQTSSGVSMRYGMDDFNDASPSPDRGAWGDLASANASGGVRVAKTLSYSDAEGETSTRASIGGGGGGGAAGDARKAQGKVDRWRAMDDTLEQVGDWAVRALPALLEITKKGS